MSDNLPTFYLGEDWTIPFQFLNDGAAWPATGATVQAGLVDAQTQALLVGPVDCDPGHAQALPSQGKLVAVFPAAAISAGGVLRGTVLLEVTVQGVGTWERRLLRVEQGAIP